MTFTSFNFLIFFPIIVFLFYLTPAKLRWITLLVGSYFFYFNIKPIYILLTTAISLSTYTFTRLIDSTPVESKKKRFMLSNIVLILIPLFFFKYFSTLNHAILITMEKSNLVWPLPDIKFILPVGISFYTFMAIGYTIDVYNEEIKAEKNPGIVALFVSFFPLVLSGPIERAKNMMPQFNSIRHLDYDKVVHGLKLMLWGYFMKLVVADRLGIYVDAVYSSVFQHNGTSLLFATILHPFQVYTDLGGYTLVAMGSAKIMGFNVMPNFNRPFFATSMAEFWRRWHMSLITWLTDYVYTPLSFSLRRLRLTGIIISLMLTFFISGVWHGAKMTYVVWGLLQGFFLSMEALLNKRKTNFLNKLRIGNNPAFLFLSMLITFILFTASLIFGRAGNMPDAWLVYEKIFTDYGPLYMDKTTLTYALTGLSVVLVKDFRDEFFPNGIRLFNSRIIFVRYATYLIIIYCILLFGVLNGGQFIYFKF